jgi:maltose phosphorylase
MAGSYLSIVQGFGGLRIRNQQLQLNPYCPPQWESYKFQILLNNQPVAIFVSKQKTEIANLSSKEIQFTVNGKSKNVEANSSVIV